MESSSKFCDGAHFSVLFQPTHTTHNFESLFLHVSGMCLSAHQFSRFDIPQEQITHTTWLKFIDEKLGRHLIVVQMWENMEVEVPLLTDQGNYDRFNDSPHELYESQQQQEEFGVESLDYEPIHSVVYAKKKRREQTRRIYGCLLPLLLSLISALKISIECSPLRSQLHKLQNPVCAVSTLLCN
jgi:hypothetical protein